MNNERIVVFDLETGGLDPDRHPIIQFAAMAVDASWNEVENLELKVQFDASKAEPEALALNGYNAEVWARDAIPESVALQRISDLMRRNATVAKVSARTGRPYSVARLCGHNAASFDAPFLAAWYKRRSEFLPAASFEPLDTVHLARWHVLRVPMAERPENLKLETLCRWAGIEHAQAHDALADVRATAALARHLLSAGTGS